MADSRTTPESSDRPADSAVDPTITVTRMLDPPAVDAVRTDPLTWPPASPDATPLLYGARSPADAATDDAPTRVQDPSSVDTRPPGVPAIAGYEIINEVGRGGMGVVYKARQLDLNRLVALKMIIGDGYERPEQLIRFRLEAETAARVRHPNVVQVYDSGTCRGRPYLVLEWVDGGSLNGYLKGKPQPPRTAARTVSLLAQAIHATHCAGIVHRDLKPGNILVARVAAMASTQTATPSTTPRGSTGSRSDVLGVTISVDGAPLALTPKVTDFGLAKEMAAETRLTETGRALGTPEYMAPEQAAGRTKQIGPATDVYALGIILYQMVTGRTPFHDASAVAIMRRVVEEEPKPPRSLQPKLPRDLETICLKCLQKDLARRYATADALANDLDCFLDGRPIAARPTGTAERAWKWAARRPAVAAMTAAAILFFVLGVAGVSWQWRVAVGQRDRAINAEGVAVKQRDRAVNAEAVTDAVNRFLIEDMIDTATPEKALGRRVTVAEVLQNASARIDGRFADQPEVAASVRVALGNAYRKLGEFGPADRHLSAGLELRRSTLGADHRDTLAVAADRGLLLADMQNWSEAIPLLRQVVATSRDKFGLTDPLTIEATGRLALVLQEHGDLAESEGLFKETLAAARERFGQVDPRTLTVLNDFGMLLQARKKLPEAETAFREAAAGRQKALTPAHPATLESVHNLAVVLDDQGRWAESKPLYRRVLTDKKRVLGSGHVDTLWTINNLALVLDQHGEPDAALVLFEDAYEGFRAALGPDNPTTLRVQNNLGDFACRYGLRSGRRELLTRAETVLSAVLTARRRTLPPNHRDVLQSVNDLAVVLLANRRPDEAGPLLTEALAGRRKELGAGHPDTLQTVTNYAQFLRGKKRTAEAIGECEDALTAAKKAGMAEHPEALKLMCTLIELLVFNKQRLPEALPHAQTALSLSIKVNGESHDETLRARRNLGAVLLDLNRPEDAEPHLRAVHAACLRSDAAHARTALAAGKVGACLLAQKRYEEAEPLLVGCYERLHAVPNAPKATVRAACEQVVQLYDAWGKSEKAAEWRERLK